MACLRWKEVQKIKQCEIKMRTSTMSLVYVYGFCVPLSFADRSGVGRVNSPGKVNLALRARIARQGELVGNT